MPAELVGVVAGQQTGRQSFAGHFESVGADTLFVPRFPFRDGVRYALLVDGEHAQTILCPPRAAGPAADVLAFYPTAPTLPLNHLRFYISFSGPMSEGESVRAVTLRRAETGALLTDTLLAMDPELWDPERRRLTVLLEPGRLKRGLVPHLESGASFQEGDAVVLHIDESFRDAHGVPLGAPAQRRYVIGPAQRTRVDPAAWRWETPAVGSIESLIVRFDRPLDRVLAEQCIDVCGSDGNRIIGWSSVGDGDAWWIFVPQTPWLAGRHCIRVESRLEDLAGNSLWRVFDRDLDQAEDIPTGTGSIELPFQPRQPA